MTDEPADDPSTDDQPLKWYKANACGGDNECIEVATATDQEGTHGEEGRHGRRHHHQRLA